MVWLVLLALLIIVSAVLIARLKQQQTGSVDGFPYQRSKALFSPAERSLLGVLEQAVGAEYKIFGKVRIADVVSVKATPNRSSWQRAFNRINAKHFDFILCRPDDLSVACAIELDDKSHQRKQRKERDDFVANLCQAISLPLLQVSARRTYSIQELRSQISLAINPQLPVL